MIVPGWIRERVAEDLFSFRKVGEGRDDEREELSVVEAVLGVLMKVSRVASKQLFFLFPS